MNILVINSGSSSLKYKLFSMKQEHVLAEGIVEKIGMKNAIVQYKPYNQEPLIEELEILEHREALFKVIQMMTDETIGVIASLKEISAVGHRIAHGGEAFADSAIADDAVISSIEENIDLAPLHNPANLKGILAFKEIDSSIPMVAVFDTAFHQTMPEKSYMYPVPKVLYDKYKIRRYGFHGTSHKYVCSRLEQITGTSIKDKKLITCHIGNGASITAIKDGISVDTSMGMTPLEGLMMGTRSGDIDPGMIQYLMMKDELTIEEANSMLNKYSGLLGISGISHDVRELLEAVEQGNKDATLAIDMYVYRISKYIGSFAAAMNGIDAIIFTGGVGENAAVIREKVCNQLAFLGLKLDKDLNENLTMKERKIHHMNSSIDVYVIQTDEELMIARDTKRLLEKAKQVVQA